jgi:hypothetical protein
VSRDTSIAIGLLKSASAASKALDVGARVGRGLKGVVVGSNDLAAGVAKGLGAPELAGRVAGGAALAGATVVGGRKIKRKADELKFRLMYGDPAQYY